VALMKRWIFYPVMAGIGFAGGALYFGSGQHRQPLGVEAVGERSLAEWAATQPGVTPVDGALEKPVSDRFERTLRSKRDGLGNAIRAHLQLVCETPPAELPALMLRYERVMPRGDSESIGGLVRHAILERLLAEDPEGLLQFALAGRSEHVESERRFVISGLRKQIGYQTLEGKIASGAIPAVNLKMMESLLAEEISDDPVRGWELAVTNGRVDFDRLASENPGPEVIEKLIQGDSPQRLSDRTIELCFESMPIGDPVSVLETVNSLEQAGERLAAIRGVGGSIGMGAQQAELESIVEGLRSDQERLVFYQASFSATVHPNSWVSAEARAGDFEKIIAIDRPSVRQTLLDQHLRAWKAHAPAEAQAWAEAHGQLERLGSLQVVAFPVVPEGFDPSDFVDSFDPPQTPSDFQFTPPGDGDDDE
jgi:hypothetical protein